MTLKSGLEEGVKALRLDLSPDTQQKLIDYVALIEKWNRTYNLTAVREPEKMLAHHILDSLSVMSHVAAATTIADVGSGAGLPGIPLALALPQVRVTLIESSQKKAAFLNQAVMELGIANATVANARVETSGAQQRFQCVISRAFSDLAEFVSLAGRICANDGFLAAMKGVHPYEELAQLPAGYRVREVVSLDVPGLGAERHLVLIERA
jgi:16S rRNA (guanine527-N7)-methyltransferase